MFLCIIILREKEIKLMNRRNAAKLRLAIRSARHDWMQRHIYYGTPDFKGFTSFYDKVKDWDDDLASKAYKQTFRWMWNRYGHLTEEYRYAF